MTGLLYQKKKKITSEFIKDNSIFTDPESWAFVLTTEILKVSDMVTFFHYIFQMICYPSF